MAELASPWLPAGHAARKGTVARDKRWRRRGNSGKVIAATGLIAQHDLKFDAKIEVQRPSSPWTLIAFEVRSIQAS